MTNKLVTALLTEAQNDARLKLMKAMDMRYSDFARDMLAIACHRHGIEWPDDMESPGGYRGWTPEEHQLWQEKQKERADELEAAMDIYEAFDRNENDGSE